MLLCSNSKALYEDRSKLGKLLFSETFFRNMEHLVQNNFKNRLTGQKNATRKTTPVIENGAKDFVFMVSSVSWKPDELCSAGGVKHQTGETKNERSRCGRVI